MMAKEVLFKQVSKWRSNFVICAKYSRQIERSPSNLRYVKRRTITSNLRNPLGNTWHFVYRFYRRYIWKAIVSLKKKSRSVNKRNQNLSSCLITESESYFFSSNCWITCLYGACYIGTALGGSMKLYDCRFYKLRNAPKV